MARLDRAIGSNELYGLMARSSRAMTICASWVKTSGRWYHPLWRVRHTWLDMTSARLAAIGSVAAIGSGRLVSLHPGSNQMSTW
jgi:hypothetical protein